MNKLLFIVTIMFCHLCGFTQTVKTPPIHSQSHVRFTENKNQWGKLISHKAQLDGGAVFVEKTGKLTFHLYDKDNYRARHLGKIISPNLKFHAYSINFIGSNTSPGITSNNMAEDYVNYFLGENSENWSSNVHHYKTITVANLYNNIDAIYEGKSQSIKYNFIVKPNGNPSDIKIHYENVKNIKLKNNELYISTSVSESIEQKPFVYQVFDNDTIEIPSKFVLQNNVVSFKLLKSYDTNKELIIDPLLVFAAQSGSTADNFGMTATYDSHGSLYTGGTAFDIGYPTTFGAYDVSYNNGSGSGFTDVVITKYDSAGTFLRYSTYLGGSTSSEIVTSLIVDKNDNLCLYGATGSNDFPTTVGCFDNTFNGGDSLFYPQNGTLFKIGTDIYAAKFNSTGTTLMASTYIGGTRNDGVNNNINPASYDSLMFNYGDQFRGEIQVDINNDVYIFSSSKSSDFPAINAIDNTLNGNQDGVLVKLDSNLTNIVYSTFIGGSNKDCGNSLTLDDSLNVYITGGTCSTDFFTTPGSYKSVYNGGKADGYLCKIKFDGSSILHSTFIGTGNYDQSYFVQLDNNKDVYIFGQTQGVMPVTAGVFSKPNSRQFIQKLNNQLTTLLASTIIGNSNGQINISPSAFSVDCAGNIYLSGWGASLFISNPLINMPLTPNAVQSSTDGHNFYVMVLAPNMASLLFGSYFGGTQSWEHVDGGTSRFDKKGIIYQSVCAGCQNNDDFPVSPGAWPTSLYGTNTNQSSNCNNGVFKIDFQLNSAIANISANTISGCEPLTINFTNNSTPGHAYLWDFGLNDTTSTIFNPIKTFTAAGTYTANLYVKTSICNAEYDTATVIITVLPKPIAAFTSTSSPCSNTISTTNNSTGSLTPTPYVWNWGDSSPTSTLTSPAHTYSTNGNYTVALTVTSTNGCTAKATETISVFDFTTTVSSNTICSGAIATIVAQGGTSYTWQPSSTLSNSLIANPSVNPTITTVYTVQIDNNSQGYLCSRTLTTQVLVHSKPVSAFTSTSSPCSNTISTTNNSTGSLGSNPYVWDWGDSSPTDTLTSPAHTYTTNGTYTLSLNVTSTDGCFAKVTETISVFNFTASVSSNTTCSGSLVPISADGGTSYTWQPSSTVTNSLASSPTVNPTVTTIYTVQINNNSQGYLCSTTLTTQVLVHPQPIANFTFSIDSCSNNINFTNQSSPVGAVNWSYSNGLPWTTFSSLQNPGFLFSGAATYSIQLISTGAFGCKDTSIKMITAPVNPVSIDPPQTKCHNESVDIQASGGTTYSWSPTTGLSNPNSWYTSCSATVTTIYTVNITQTSLLGKVCTKTLTTSVNVHPVINSDFTYTISPCGNTIDFTDASSINPVNWDWNLAPGIGNISLLQNPSHFYGSPGIYTISLIVKNNFGCSDTSNKIISLSGFPPMSVSSSVLQCKQDTVQLSATGGDYYLWQPSLYLSNATIFNPLAFPPATTIYTVTMGTINGLDTCKTSLTTTVSILPMTYNADSISISSHTITLGESIVVNLSGFPYFGNISIVPIIPIEFSSPTAFSFTPTKTGDYTVYFTDQNGCRHALKTIEVEVVANICNQDVVYLPTGFTPNNDGTNDILYIRSNFITDVYLTIYDRWGEKLFETNDVKKGWDGTYKGKPLDQGVYGYYMTFTCNNKEQSFKKGNITLMK